jgi:hypothetical protein
LTKDNVYFIKHKVRARCGDTLLYSQHSKGGRRIMSLKLAWATHPVSKNRAKKPQKVRNMSRKCSPETTSLWIQTLLVDSSIR